jgi:carbamate kinase
MVTHVVVDRGDTAFESPTKPIGPHYDEATARELERDRGWTLREETGRGWRRVVPSPRPLEVLELDAVRTLLDAGQLVVAVGGGGIPVVRRDQAFEGIDAVIDKDHASALLAVGLGAERLVILTQVPGVYRDFDRDGGHGEPIVELGAEKDAGIVEELPAGSMRPKVEAAFAFVSQTGGEALITSADAVRDGGGGTRVAAA